MAHQEEEARRSRVVVNTPTSQREVVRSEAVKYPEREGVSGGVLAAIVVGVVALAAIAVLFLMNRQQQDANANVASQPPQTTIVQQPAQQPPVVVQPPAPATQPAPVIFNNPCPRRLPESCLVRKPVTPAESAPKPELRCVLVCKRNPKLLSASKSALSEHLR